jgi:hypothetical protein
MHKWEYKIAYPGNGDFENLTWEETLNKLGDEGWELVSSEIKMPISNVNPYTILLIFKREQDPWRT